MVTRDEYLAKTKGYNRPAINFNQRDDIRDFARSGVGQNYHRMMDLQSQKNPNLQDLKQSRRQWNRYDKYNAGRMLDKSPTEMQDMFSRDTEVFRQRNKPGYNKMYPITGKFMDVAEKGGIWGAMLSNFLGGKGKEIKKSIQSVGDRIGGGISNFIDDEKEKEEYAAKTFPFYPSDVHPDEYDITDTAIADWYEPEEVIESPGPIDRHPDKYPISREAGQPPLGAVDVTGDPTRRRDVGYDITASDLDVAPSPNPNIVDMDYWNWVDQFYDTHHPDGTPKADPRVIPGVGTSYVDDFADVVGEEEVPTALPPYQGREFGLGQFMKEMPSSRKSDWEDYLKYVQRLGDMEAGYHKQKLTYDEWHRMMRRRR